MNSTSKDHYDSIAPCTFELFGGKMKLGGPLLTSRPVRTCKVCGSPDKCDFNTPDDTWKMVVPIKYQNAFVCVECFGRFACEKQIKLFQVNKHL